MPPETSSTSWRVIAGAAAGAISDREEFVRIYGPAVRDYLVARWGGSSLAAEIDDAAQEVFVECFRAGGVLVKADRERSGGFRALLYGVLRNVALRHEDRVVRDRRVEVLASDVPAQVETSSARFDRAWAHAVMREAAVRHRERAFRAGDAAVQRFELLRLRFQEGLPIREVSRRWNVPAARLHHDFAIARREFETALREIIERRHPGGREQQERVLQELIDALG